MLLRLKMWRGYKVHTNNVVGDTGRERYDPNRRVQ